MCLGFLNRIRARAHELKAQSGRQHGRAYGMNGVKKAWEFT